MNSQIQVGSIVLICLCALLPRTVLCVDLTQSPQIWSGNVSQVHSSGWDSSETVHSVFCDSNGLIWFGSNLGLYVYTGEQPKRVESEAIQASKGEFFEVLDITEREGADEIWFLTNEGVGKISASTMEPEFFAFGERNEGFRCTDFSLSNSGDFWISSSNGLFRFFPEEGKLEKVPGPVEGEDSHFYNVVCDRQNSGQLWVTDPLIGFYRYEIGTGNWMVYTHAQRTFEDTEYELAYGLKQTRDGTIWVGGRNRVTQIIFSEKEEMKTFHFVSNEKAYGQGFVSDIHEAGNGSIWISTKFQTGLLHLNPEKNKLEDFGWDMRLEGARKGYYIGQIAVDSTETVWLATEKNGLIKATRGILDLQRFESRIDLKTSIHGALPLRVHPISSTEFQIRSGEGMARVNLESKTAVRISPKSPANNIEGLLDSVRGQNGRTYGMFTDGIKTNRKNEGNVWRWQNEITFDEGVKGAPAVFSHGFDQDGKVWFVRGNQIFRFRPGDKEIEAILKLTSWAYFIEIDNEFAWISVKNSVLRVDLATLEMEELNFGEAVDTNHITVDLANNRIWVACARGVLAVNRHDLSYQAVQGLKGNVESLCLGESGNLWVTTGGFLRMVDTKNREIRGYAVQSDLDQRGYHVRSVMKGSDDLLLLGAWNQLLAVSEAALLEKTKIEAPLVLSSVSLIDANSHDKKTGAEPIFHGQHYSAKFDPSVVGAEIQFSLLDYRVPHANQYQYRIDQSRWVDAPNGKIRLSGLRPGSHLIAVKATSANGAPAANEFQFRIRCLAPLWRQPVFVSVVLGSLFLFGYGIANSRIRLIQRAKADLEKANSALSSSEIRYRRIFDRSMDAIVLLGKDNEITGFNPAASKLLGVNEFAEKLPSFLSFCENSGRIDELISRSREGNSISDEPLEIHSSKGDRLHTLVSVAPQDEDEVRLHLRDITKQADLESHMQHAQKMEAVGTLAGGIAHDFNNLLSPVILHSQVAHKDLKADGSKAIPATLESLEVCEEAAIKAAGLVKNLLQFARTQDDGEKVNDLTEICESCIRLLRASIPSNIQIKAELPDTPAHVFCSGQRFEQTLTNLGVNAGHAIGTVAGTITISLKRNAQDRWELQVKDTGCGMTRETVKRVFEPFFTTKDVGKGTGLGLAMVHTFIQESQGTINIDSEPDLGTVFTLSFPQSQIDEAKSRETPAIIEFDDHRNSGAQKESILVIDDDLLVLKATSLILGKQGYDVTSFDSPVKALEAYQSGPLDFQAVVTDQMMPEMTGIELADEIAKSNSGIPIVLLTGFSEAVLRDQMSETHIDAIHMKPLDYSTLNTTLQSLIHQNQRAKLALPA